MADRRVNAVSQMNLVAGAAKYSFQQAAASSAEKTRQLLESSKNRKKPRKWELPKNKGVESRAARDSAAWARLAAPAEEEIQARLARKAKIYDNLKKGRTAGLTEAQIENLNVDFDAKAQYESDSDDVDESLTVPAAPNTDDPIVEYVDDFGRTRTARRSEVPRQLVQDESSTLIEDDPYEIRGQTAANNFMVYERTEEEVEKIRQEFSEENNPLVDRYDPTKEIRAKGAAYYKFSTDEERRKAEQENLRGVRNETIQTREKMGAIDSRVGVDPNEAREGAPVAPAMSRAQLERKRKLEERERLIQEKRQKREHIIARSAPPPAPPIPIPPTSVAPPPPPEDEEEGPSPPPPSSKKAPSATSAADDFLANLERNLNGR